MENVFPWVISQTSIWNNIYYIGHVTFIRIIYSKAKMQRIYKAVKLSFNKELTVQRNTYKGR